MIVEEKKANKLRCCGPLAETKCQGSQCMAWRWTDDNVAVENPLHVQPRWEVRRSTTHGFCGLAGRP